MNTSLLSRISVIAFLAMTPAIAGEVDPRAPVENVGMKVIVDGQGVQAPGYEFRNDCAKPSPWQAEWVFQAIDHAGLFDENATPQGDVVVSWTMGEGKFTLDVTVPTGTDAEIELPVSRFGKPVILMNGQKVGPKVNVSAGVNHFEITCDLK